MKNFDNLKLKFKTKLIESDSISTVLQLSIAFLGENFEEKEKEFHDSKFINEQIFIELNQRGNIFRIENLITLKGIIH